MYVGRCPTEELTYTNRAIVNPGDFPDDIKWVLRMSQKSLSGNGFSV